MIEKTFVSADDFIKRMLDYDVPVELVDGHVVGMRKGASQAQSIITSNIIACLVPQAKSCRCRTVGNTAVRTGPATVRFPNLLVDCGPRDASSLLATQPALLVELSSSGTTPFEATDRLEEYQALDTVKVIMLVNSEVMFVKVYRRPPDGT